MPSQSGYLHRRKSRLKPTLTASKKTCGYCRSFTVCSLEEANGTTLKLGNGNTIYCFSLSPTSHLESKTLHLAIIEEAQKIDDEKAKNEVFPILASTNGSKIFIGSGGYQLCDSIVELRTEKRVPFWLWASDRWQREAVPKNQNPLHKKKVQGVCGGRKGTLPRGTRTTFKRSTPSIGKIGRGMLITASRNWRNCRAIMKNADRLR